MPDIITQILIYMSCTFLLGLVLGWLLWKFGSAKQFESMTAEVTFWKSNLEQSRLEREADIGKINALNKERENLKKRLAAISS